VKRSIYVGWDPREADAFAVAMSSIARHLSTPIPLHSLILADLEARGLYSRPTAWRPGPANRPVMWDIISDAPISTQHACARFLVPHLAKEGWALFMDGDMLVRSDLAEVFEGLDPAKAVYCVQHRQTPSGAVKMDGQVQTPYARKNWSSFCIFNASHEANRALTVAMVNSLPGRDLHRFCWMEDDLIGALDPTWNVLVGPEEPKVAHFTHGLPGMPGYEDVPFADEWREELATTKNAARLA
jgi:hypothetical protein